MGLLDKGREKVFIKEFRILIKKDTSKIKSVNDETNLYKEARKKIGNPLNNKKKFKKLFPELDFYLTKSLFKVFNSKTEDALFTEFEIHYRRLKNKEKTKIKETIKKIEETRHPESGLIPGLSGTTTGGFTIGFLKEGSKAMITAYLPFAITSGLIFVTTFSLLFLNAKARKKLIEKLNLIMRKVDAQD